MPSRYQARVIVHAPAATMSERPYLCASVEAINERACEVRTSDDWLDWLAMRIGMSASTSRFTSRPSSRSGCARSGRASVVRRVTFAAASRLRSPSARRRDVRRQRRVVRRPASASALCRARFY
jgi:hypothetical protein